MKFFAKSSGDKNLVLLLDELRKLALEQDAAVQMLAEFRSTRPRSAQPREQRQSKSLRPHSAMQASLASADRPQRHVKARDLALGRVVADPMTSSKTSVSSDSSMWKASAGVLHSSRRNNASGRNTVPKRIDHVAGHESRVLARWPEVRGLLMHVSLCVCFCLFTCFVCGHVSICVLTTCVQDGMFYAASIDHVAPDGAVSVLFSHMEAVLPVPAAQVIKLQHPLAPLRKGQAVMVRGSTQSRLAYVPASVDSTLGEYGDGTYAVSTIDG